MNYLNTLILFLYSCQQIHRRQMPIQKIIKVLSVSSLSAKNLNANEIDLISITKLKNIFGASIIEFYQHPSLSLAMRNWAHTTIDSIDATTKEFLCHWKLLRKNSGTMITILDPNYPPLLKNAADPPLALNFLGSVFPNHKKNIAIIGSRKAYPETLEVTRELSARLTENYNIISGGAYGCDIAAHIGALSCTDPNKYTAAIMAGGLGSLYPPGNIHVFQRMRASLNGALISERLWHMKAKPYDFPIRNRLITGISYATLVMQAGEKSGALNSAEHALNQGREVMVYYPNYHCAGFEGSLKLINNGAKVI